MRPGRFAPTRNFSRCRAARLALVALSGALAIAATGCPNSSPSPDVLGTAAVTGTVDEPLLVAVNTGEIGRPAVVSKELMITTRRPGGPRSTLIEWVSIDPFTPNPSRVEEVAAFGGHPRGLQTDGRFVVWPERAAYSSYSTTILDTKAHDGDATEPFPWPEGPASYRDEGPQLANGWLARARWGDPGTSGGPLASAVVLQDLNTGGEPIVLPAPEFDQAPRYSLSAERVLWSAYRGQELRVLDAPFDANEVVDLSALAFPGGGTFWTGPWQFGADVFWATSNPDAGQVSLIHWNADAQITPDENPRALTTTLAPLGSTRIPTAAVDRHAVYFDGEFQITTRGLEDPNAPDIRRSDGTGCARYVWVSNTHVLWAIAELPSVETIQTAQSCGGRRAIGSIQYLARQDLPDPDAHVDTLPLDGVDEDSLVAGAPGLAWVESRRQPGDDGRFPTLPLLHRTRFLNPNAPLEEGVNPVDLVQESVGIRVPVAFTEHGLLLAGLVDPDAQIPPAEQEHGVWLYDEVSLLRATEP